MPEINTKDLVQGFEEWVANETAANAYPQEPPNFSTAFPIVMASIKTDEEQVTDPKFGDSAYEQMHVQVIGVELALLIDPEPEWTSDQALYDLVDEIKDALKRDTTLGGLVKQTSRLYRVEYRGEAQLPDGTRANGAVMSLTTVLKVSS